VGEVVLYKELGAWPAASATSGHQFGQPNELEYLSQTVPRQGRRCFTSLIYLWTHVSLTLCVF